MPVGLSRSKPVAACKTLEAMSGFELTRSWRGATFERRASPGRMSAARACERTLQGIQVDFLGQSFLGRLPDGQEFGVGMAGLVHKALRRRLRTAPTARPAPSPPSIPADYVA